MSLIQDLKNVGIVKYGNFTLKSGKQSNIYFNLREIISHPNLLSQVGDMIYEKIKHYNFDRLCGVPYTGIPIVTYISQTYNIPMIICKKERKQYGLGGIIDGTYEVGDRIILIDDLITDGKSKMEFIEILENEFLNVNVIAVFLDRSEGKTEIPLKYKVESIFNMDDFLKSSKKPRQKKQSRVKKISQDLRLKNKTEISKRLSTKTNLPENFMNTKKSKIEMTTGNIKRNQLLDIINKKKTNLILSADLNKSEEIISILEQVGKFICCVKFHIDIIDFKHGIDNFIKDIVYLSKKYNFMILVDRKFCDIGNTVAHQVHRGTFRISEWADLVTVHSVMGEGTIQGLISDKDKTCPGILLLGQASSKGNLISQTYTDQTIEIAKKYSDHVVGFICQEKLCEGFIHCTPGVNISTSGDSLGQQYNSPEYVIGTKNVDIIIVGRGIYASQNPETSARLYRDEGWKWYTSKKV